MVFSSIFFLYCFLPITFVLYFAVKNIRYKNIILMLISLLFYAWGEPIYVLLMIFSVFLVYICGLCIDKSTKKWQRVTGLIVAVTINLAMLGVFKYTGFFVNNLNNFFHLGIAVPEIRLPIGISFFTFQALSYCIDVYRKDVEVQKSYINLLLYVSMFPQLIAGPIVRYSEIEKQITYRESSIDNISEGISRFIIGLGKKVLIANVCGSLIKETLDLPVAQLSIVMSWLGIILFTLQIYFDFSGYSDMAIGLGKIFGFKYNENFNYPYISKSITEFWRRWHISLGSFFRDYLYIPLGGNRKRQLLNIGIVWLLTGLWHGASWNYVLWGLYHGIFIILEKIFLLKVLKILPKFLANLYTMLVVTLGFVIFYFTSLSTSIKYWSTMFGYYNNPLYNLETEIFLSNNFIFLIIAVIMCLPVRVFLKKIFNANSENKALSFTSNTLGIIINLAILLASTALLLGESYNPFLYFRF